MSLELEQWVVCVRQLEDVLVLQTLLLVPPPQGAAGSPVAQCSIKTLLEGGTGRLHTRMSIIFLFVSLTILLFFVFLLCFSINFRVVSTLNTFSCLYFSFLFTSYL